VTGEEIMRTYRAMRGNGDTSGTSGIVDVVAWVVDFESVVAHLDGWSEDD